MPTKIERLSYFLFFFTNLLLLVNPGVFFDDWTIYNMSDKGIMAQFKANGLPFLGYLHILLKNLGSSPLLYHLLTFLLQLLSVFLLFRIHDEINFKKKYSQFFLFSIMMFAVVPIYDAKITMIVFPYTLCLTLFLIGTYFLIRFKISKKLTFRVLSLFFFFFSFFTNSLLFFYITPLFFAFFYDSLSKPWSIEKLRKWIYLILNNLDFFLLPIVFWIIKLSFFRPSDHYGALNYNEIQLEVITSFPSRLFVFFKIHFFTAIPLIKEALQTPEIWIIFFVVAFFIHFKFSDKEFNFKVSSKTILWGLLILIIGVFPYLLVQKIPSYLYYSSRHQLLLGFGICIIVTGLIFLLKHSSLKKYIFTFCLSFFVSFNILLHFNFFKGYIKHEVFEDFLVTLADSGEPKTIYLDDNTLDFTHRGHPERFDALAGMRKKNGFKENILIMSKSKFEQHIDDIITFYSPNYIMYSLNDYEYREPTGILKVHYSEIARPSFPMISYYSDFILGKTEKWRDYFVFNLEPL